MTPATERAASLYLCSHRQVSGTMICQATDVLYTIRSSSQDLLLLDRQSKLPSEPPGCEFNANICSTPIVAWLFFPAYLERAS